MPDVYYCDNYEEVTGRKKDGTLRDSDDQTVAVVETKVVAPPAPPAPKSATEAETK